MEEESAGWICSLQIGEQEFLTRSTTISRAPHESRLRTVVDAITVFADKLDSTAHKGEDAEKAHSQKKQLADVLVYQGATFDLDSFVENYRAYYNESLCERGAFPRKGGEFLERLHCSGFKRGRSIFFDRNPNSFVVVLDFLRTGKVLLPPSVSRQQAEEEFAYFGVPLPSQRLRATARETLLGLYGSRLDSVEAELIEQLETASRQGRMAVVVGYVSRAYMVGTDPVRSEAACRELAALFERGHVEEESVQVLALAESRHEISQRLAGNGLVSSAMYSTGDVYGKGVASHAVFAVGLDESIVLLKLNQIAEKLKDWVPGSFSSEGEQT